MDQDSSDSLIPYDDIVQDALRGVVSRVLQRISDEGGLPGGHHFYIAFRTRAPGVSIPKHLMERYPDEMTIVIILNLDKKMIGVVVDSVSDVIQLDPEEIREAPPLHGDLDTRFIRGLATLNERMVILMDIETLMSSPDMALVADAA